MYIFAFIFLRTYWHTYLTPRESKSVQRESTRCNNTEILAQQLQRQSCMYFFHSDEFRALSLMLGLTASVWALFPFRWYDHCNLQNRRISYKLPERKNTQKTSTKEIIFLINIKSQSTQFRKRSRFILFSFRQVNQNCVNYCCCFLFRARKLRDDEKCGSDLIKYWQIYMWIFYCQRDAIQTIKLFILLARCV